MAEEVTMSRRCQKNPLRPLLEEERGQLIHLSRCQAGPAGLSGPRPKRRRAA